MKHFQIVKKPLFSSISDNGLVSEKIIHHVSKTAVPFIGYLPEKNEVGIGLRTCDTGKDPTDLKTWTMAIFSKVPMPVKVIHLWRAMKILAETPIVKKGPNGTLVCCWHAATVSIEVNKIDYLEELAELWESHNAFYERRNEILKLVPSAEDLKLLITAFFWDLGIDFSKEELGAEIAAGRLSETAFLNHLLQPIE